MKRFMHPLFDADTGDGGTLEAITKVGEAVAKIDTDNKESKAEITKIAEELATAKVDSEKEILALSGQVKAMKGALAKSYGPSGADDWLMDMAKYIGGVYAVKCGIEPQGEIGGEKISDLVSRKAAADYSTTTAATAGYLLPSVLMPGIRELKDLYGNFYPAVTKVTGVAGQTIQMNRDSISPLAYWRAAQNAVITPDAAPMTFTQSDLVSILCGARITIANELLSAPGVNFSAVATVRLLKAILRKLEFGMIAGTAAGDEPTDGLIASATSAGTIATMSFANLITFLKTAIGNNEYAYDTTSNAIMMTPGDALTLAGEQTGTTGPLIWGNPETGTKTTLMGYPLITHPACNNATNKYVILGDPSAMTLVESSAFSVDISGEAGSSFENNESMLRAFNHYDWNVGQPAEWHAAIVTA